MSWRSTGWVAAVKVVLVQVLRAYSTGRASSLGGLPRLEVEEKDRTLAFSGPHSRHPLCRPEAEINVHAQAKLFRHVDVEMVGRETSVEPHAVRPNRLGRCGATVLLCVLQNLFKLLDDVLRFGIE